MHFGASLVAQTVKSLPAVQETWVQSLRQEDSLEKEMTTHCSILVWKIPWTEEPVRLQESQESDTTEQLHFSLSLYASYLGTIPTVTIVFCLYQFQSQAMHTVP